MLLLISGIIVVLTVGFLSLARYKKKISNYRKKYNTQHSETISKDPMPNSTITTEQEYTKTLLRNSTSPYLPNFIVLRINAFHGKPYMGYELYQALFDLGLRLAERGLFNLTAHTHSDRERVLFSLAAATPDGIFPTENIGSFTCHALLLFINLDDKKRLMERFDLMLDTARQLTEALGGEIIDDASLPISVATIKGMRERICRVDTNHQYLSDLLDNLD